MQEVKKKRNAGVDRLKVLAILMIIIYHSVHTLSFQEGISDFTLASKSIQHFTLSLLSTFGVLGNNIFFVCSAWFLVDSKKVDVKRAFRMLSEIWFISVAILAVSVILKSSKLQNQNLLSFFFPTFFGNNWYMTCYLLFYLAHQGLNEIINQSDRERLFNIAFWMTVLYLGLSFLVYGHLYVSALVVWISMYFVIAYLKKNRMDYCDSGRMNGIALGIGLIGQTGLMLTTNILGLRVGFLRDMVLHWNSSSSPFLFLTAFSLLNLFRIYGGIPEKKIRNISFFSGLSMYIYLFHENLIIRRYRTNLFQFFFRRYGMDHLVLYVFVVAIIVFVVSSTICTGYKLVAQKRVQYLADHIFDQMSSVYRRMRKCMIYNRKR